MAHSWNRHLLYPSEQPGTDDIQICNQSYPNPSTCLGNSSFAPQADGAVVSGANLPAYNTVATAPNYPSSCFNAEFPNHWAVNPGTSHSTYMHPSNAGSSSNFSSIHAQHWPSCYNQPMIREGCSTVNPQMDNARVGSKRKSPAMPLITDGVNTTGHYHIGSSSNNPISSDHLPPNPIPGPQSWFSDPMSVVPSNRNDNLLTVGEGSQRNVRSRRSRTFHLEFKPAGHSSSSNMPHSFYSRGSVSGPRIGEQWSHTAASMAPQARALSSGASGFNHALNQPRSGGTVSNASLERDGHHPNFVHNWNLSAPWATLHGPSAQSMEAVHSSYGQRTAPYMTISSYPPTAFAATSIRDVEQSGVEIAASSRRSRPLPTVGHTSNMRNGRARNAFGGFHSFSDDMNARNRWVSEGVAMMDGLIFDDSRDLFDQHRDMRLDIDNMGYEELLALGEQIGNVSTGLSEDMISRCLTETASYSSHQTEDDQDEGHCAICLDEYKDQDKLGRLNCRHDFHVGCIKQWLQIKNVCPICKASACEDASKGKQNISL